MNTSTKILGITAAVALISAPALAGETVKVKVGERVTYETKDVAAPGDNVVGYEIEAQQEFARIDTNSNGSISRNEFYDNVMLDEEAEIFALFDTNQDNNISAEEYSANSRYGNAQVTNRTTNNLRNTSGQQIGSMRAKYYEPAELDITYEGGTKASYNYN